MNSAILTLITLVFKILDLSRDLVVRYEDWKRNRKIKKQYQHGEKIVKDGDVKEINDILK